MVLSTTGTVLIDPYVRWDARYALSYFKRDGRRAGASPFRCEVVDEKPGELLDQALADAQPVVDAPSGTQLRTYRLALAGTVEYTTAVCAPNPAAVACGLAAMVVSMNRVTGVYEREVAVRMVLVANNNLVVYTTAPDPYSNGNGSTMLGQNQSNLDAVIGTANYDIGHVFSTGGGGVANLNVPCTSSKARGVTGQSNPVGDPFDIDYVAHEMGHQFGGAHTFNGTTNNCGGGNRSGTSAYEPGSGTTIMAYAGICGAEDLQRTATTPSTSAASTRSSPSPPAPPVARAPRSPPPATPCRRVNAGAAYTIPKQTPSPSPARHRPDPDTLTYMGRSSTSARVAAQRRHRRGAADLPLLRAAAGTQPHLPRWSDISATSPPRRSMSTRNRTMTSDDRARQPRQRRRRQLGSAPR